MRKLVFKGILVACLLFASFLSKSQWIARNAGWPLYGGTYDKCYGTAAISGCLIAATQHNGILKATINSSGTPTSSWTKPTVGNPAINGYVPTIVATTTDIFYLSGSVGMYHYRPTGTAFTAINAGLAFIPDNGILDANGTTLYFVDVDNSLIYKRNSTSDLNQWIDITPVALSSIAGTITCMKMKGSLMYFGTTSGLYAFPTTGTAIQTVMSGKPCYNIQTVTDLSNNPKHEVLALIGNSSTSPHPNADFVRFDKTILPPLVFSQVNYGVVASTNEKIFTTKSSSALTANYYCTNRYTNPSFTAVQTLSKSTNQGSTWIDGNTIGLPSTSGFRTHTMLSSYGLGTTGNSYTFIEYAGFYSRLDLSTLRESNDEFFEDAEKEVSIYPNPTNNEFSLKGMNSDIYTVMIFDINGNSIINLNGSISEINAKLPSTSTWKNGIYLVRAQNKNTDKITTLKLVKGE